MHCNQRVEKLGEKTGCRLVHAVVVVVVYRSKLYDWGGEERSARYLIRKISSWQLLICFLLDSRPQIKRQTMKSKHPVMWILRSHVIACCIHSCVKQAIQFLVVSGTCLNLVFCPNDCRAIVICVNILDLVWYCNAVSGWCEWAEWVEWVECYNVAL